MVGVTVTAIFIDETMTREPKRPKKDAQRARIIKIAEYEFPGHIVIFDEESRDIRFRIEDVQGRVWTKAHPHFYPSKIDDLTDEELRSLLRQLCGFSH